MQNARDLHPPLAASSLLRRHPLDAITDRPRREAALAVAATWVLFMAGLAVAGEVLDPISFVIGGVSGAALIWLGFVAASRCRTLPAGAKANPARLVLLAIAAGVAMGLANLAANWAIAASDPALRTLLADRIATVPLPRAVFAAPVVEEVAMRLFLLSALTWVIFRVTRRVGLAFALALAGSAFLFATLHLDRPMPADPVLANYYRVALLAKYTLIGAPLGVIFWRWGLPFAILCHAATNATHLALQHGVF